MHQYIPSFLMGTCCMYPIFVPYSRVYFFKEWAIEPPLVVQSLTCIARMSSYVCVHPYYHKGIVPSYPYKGIVA